MTKNTIAYALIAGLVAIGITSATLAMAQTTETEPTFHVSGTPIAGFKVMDLLPEIMGSINVGEDIMSSKKVSLPEAATIAEDETGGAVTTGSLGVQNGYLVYTFAVISEDQMRTVIVDAGNGEVLHVSEPHTVDAVSMLISGNHMMKFKHVSAPWAAIHAEKITSEE